MSTTTSRSVWVDFQEVRETVSIPNVLEHYGIREKFTEKKGKLRGECPLPQHNYVAPIPNRQGFSVDRNKGVWLYRCWGDCRDQPWGCGDVIALVCAMEQYDEGSEAMRLARFWFARHFGRVLNLHKRKEETPTSETEKACEDADESNSSQALTDEPSTVAEEDAPLKPLRWAYRDLDPEAEYLVERGICAGTACHFGFGLLHPKPNKARVADGYICFPAYRLGRGADENPLGYQGRYGSETYEEEDKPRYMNWFDVGKALFGINESFACSDDHSPLIVVEGCLKAAWLFECGFAAPVSTFSSTVTDEQAQLLAATKRPLLIFFDGDESGYQGARTAVAKLSYLSYVRRVDTPAGKAPDDFSGAELHEILTPLLK